MLRMMAAIEPNRPDFSFLAGWEPAMVPMLAIGCQGGTFAMSGVVPEITRKIYDLIIADEWNAARTLQMRLTELFDLTVLGVNFPEGVRTAIEMRGFEFGRGRQPLDVAQHLDREVLAQKVDRLLSSV